MDNKKCQTCKNIKHIIELEEQYPKTCKHDWGVTKNKLVCSPISLTVAKWNGENEWKNKGSITYAHEPLNFCSACGEKIKE